MKISKQSKRDAKGLFRSSLVKGVMDENRVRQVVKQVIALKPRGYAGILDQLHKLVKLELARRAAKVESAVPMEAVMRSQIEQNLARIYGPGLNVAYTENKALLGGLRVQVGSDVYDGSVQARLTELEKSF